MLENDFIAATANLNELDPKLEGANIVSDRIDNAGLKRVMTNNFGFGGTNGTLIFEKV
jgi:3-oxoacyl-[acyl-carrier-protein] synthase-1